MNFFAPRFINISAGEPFTFTAVMFGNKFAVDELARNFKQEVSKLQNLKKKAQSNTKFSMTV